MAGLAERCGDPAAQAAFLVAVLIVPDALILPTATCSAAGTPVPEKPLRVIVCAFFRCRSAWPSPWREHLRERTLAIGRFPEARASTWQPPLPAFA